MAPMYLESQVKLTGMYATFAPAIDFSGGKYGIGILSKEQPINTRAVALPGREEARALLVAEFEDYLFCATHFSLTPQDQLASATIIKDLFKDIKKPIFLAGDMNSTPGDSTQSALTSHFTALTDTTLFTHPANTPNVCIDYIYINKAHSDRFEVTKQAVIADSVASDHRPVQVVIRSKK